MPIAAERGPPATRDRKSRPPCTHVMAPPHPRYHCQQQQWRKSLGKLPVSTGDGFHVAEPTRSGSICAVLLERQYHTCIFGTAEWCREASSCGLRRTVTAGSPGGRACPVPAIRKKRTIRGAVDEVQMPAVDGGLASVSRIGAMLQSQGTPKRDTTSVCNLPDKMQPPLFKYRLNAERESLAHENVQVLSTTELP